MISIAQPSSFHPKAQDRSQQLKHFAVRPNWPTVRVGSLASLFHPAKPPEAWTLPLLKATTGIPYTGWTTRYLDNPSGYRISERKQEQESPFTAKLFFVIFLTIFPSRFLSSEPNNNLEVSTFINFSSFKGTWVRGRRTLWVCAC